MDRATIEVIAGSRLHFGMLAFGGREGRQFGGLGAMVTRPTLRLSIAPAEQFTCQGPLTERVTIAARRAAGHWQLEDLPACKVEVLSVPPQHAGFGSGTQLALAVVAGLNAIRDRPALEPAELAELAGRAERSSIGTYGFTEGGLLFEAGKLPGEPIGPLQRRVELPATWRFVLIWPRHEQGLSGDDERSAFSALPPVPEATTLFLQRLIEQELIPAAERQDFDRFSRHLYDYGHAAGMCFAARQCGAFASPKVERLIRTLRDWNVPGVGQSSWGPGVFALVEDAAGAESLLARLRAFLSDEFELCVAEPNNRGASIIRR